MKKLELGQSVGILANLGVIAGIFFLGLELRQNNELMEAEARLTQANTAIGAYSLMIESPGLASAIAKLRTGDELSPTEQVHLQAFALRVFRNFQWQYGEFRLGTLDESIVPLMRAVVRSEGGIGAEIPYRDYWNEYRRRAPSDFVEWFEENVVNVL